MLFAIPPFSVNVAERNQVSGPIARASRRENAPAD
jgi:hypothetical protein